MTALYALASASNLAVRSSKYVLAVSKLLWLEVVVVD